MIDTGIAFSRPSATAAKLATFAADAHRFAGKPVLLTGEPDILLTDNGRWAFLDSIRLLVRVCRNLTIFVPQGPALAEESRALANELQFAEPVIFVETKPNFSEFSAILSVGTLARLDFPWTVINSNGWLARVSSLGSQLPSSCGQPNPVGALAAACLGVTDVFKRLVGLRDSRGPLFDGLEFSTYSHELGPCPGPPLPDALQMPPTLMPGQGAIGNGLVLLLSRLPLQGELWLMDRQSYGEENLGTCVLIGPDDINHMKADVNVQYLKQLAPNIDAKPLVGAVEDLASGKLLIESHPRIVLGGLDNIEARYEIQRLWPDIIIDGAIGDFGCQVAENIWGTGSACMRCLFVEAAGLDHHAVAREATGLPKQRLEQPESLLMEQDLVGLDKEKRALLVSHIGKKMCSIVSIAVMAAIQKDRPNENFQPTVPFVACMSATLVAAHFVRYLLDGLRKPSPRFIFDMLTGPGYGEQLLDRPKANCECVRRVDVITQWRRGRFDSKVL